MRPFEIITAWNQRVAAGETPNTWPADELGEALPVIALTCIDPRLNAHFPNALGLRPDQFIWLRNAGNVISSSTSSTLRSLALACAVKGGREVAIIGHTDCGVRKIGMTELVDRFRALGIPRERLPEDLVTFFGMFASERQNVIRGTEFARQSSLIGPLVPVHGLLMDVQNGRLEWVVNGYEAMQGAAHSTIEATRLETAPVVAEPAPSPRAPNAHIVESAGVPPPIPQASVPRPPKPLAGLRRNPGKVRR